MYYLIQSILPLRYMSYMPGQLQWESNEESYAIFLLVTQSSCCPITWPFGGVLPTLLSNMPSFLWHSVVKDSKEDKTNHQWHKGH